MKITAVSTAVVEANFDWTIVKIDTDSGITGWGEAFFAPGLTATIAALGQLIRHRDPRQVQVLVRDMRQAASAAGSGGQVFHAITGIEIALWDILAKSLDVPLWQLWGGRFRNSVRIYADCHGGDALESLDPLLQPRRPAWDKSQSAWSAAIGWKTTEVLASYTPEAYANKAQSMVQAGFDALKFDVDIPNPWTRDAYNRALGAREIDYIGNLLQAVRDRVGPGVDVAVDCHWKFSPESALELARALEPFKLLWLEDPIPPENIEVLRELRVRSPVPILTGENLYGAHEFRRLIESQAASIIAPDLHKVGGLAEGLRVSQLADLYYMLVAPHNIASPIGTLAAVHLCATIPNFLALEWHASDVPFWNDLVHEARLIREGYIQVPDTPGLGITVNEDVIRRYAKRGESVFAPRE
ncbi:MAG: mandelate racemase/muconate lactonizing enzyme family protein [Firmicutes bacterium]|nr:mandelate racemase/muconate lactonizing enzyme family protein [Bacillota bacterium]